MNLYRAYVYILSNKKRTVFYTGVTNDLERRIKEHKDGTGSVFTKKYNVHYLIFYEVHNNIEQAIKREKIIKKWKKEWKLNATREINPEVKDLAQDWIKLQDS